MSGLRHCLTALGALLLLGGLAGAGAWLTGTLPPERLKAALAALRNTAQTPPEPPSRADSEPTEPSVLLEAREKLAEDQEAFRQEQTLAQSQIQAERAELESLQKTVETRLQTVAREEARLAASSVSAGGASSTVTLDPGAKAVAELASRMTPKDAAQMLAAESEADAARILRKMDPKQAGKVMTEMMTGDAARAQRIVASMKSQAK